MMAASNGYEKILAVMKTRRHRCSGTARSAGKYGGYDETVSWLIEKGASVDLQNENVEYSLQIKRLQRPKSF